MSSRHTFVRPKVVSIEEADWQKGNYDISVFALGFESRSTSFLGKVNAKGAIAYGFDHGHQMEYELNLKLFQSAGVEVLDFLSDNDFEVAFRQTLSALPDDNQKKIFVDVSCFTRFRLAAIVHELFIHAGSRHQDLVVDFAYAVAKFEKPSIFRQPNTVVGPAHRAFAGWSQGNYSSTATILGLGYEQDQAIGVVEYLQSGEVWAFSPISPVDEYKPAVAKANELLLSEIPPSHVIEYDVCSPASVVTTLESVVRGLTDEHSVVLVPFGPKIFVLCTLIVAAIRQDVAVWRVSQGSHIKPHDRSASHIKVGLRLIFRAEN
ncbi:hypothetical protein [Comamonas endophytica]|uniref:Uncharacterized protein n=1 Tax=Comamonas endophytica TaxID=2949090 RepID=A0ABY6G996_9BURK|nr:MULTISPECIES: hypothetical protein [unclassified Acidovorax]MCD2511578.1 hypothetical protein [Acidovorax sp. D4N7]UYG50962.1 hypothetical protein M9799_12795 [Acidovorax sp. 5MLIR]